MTTTAKKLFNPAQLTNAAATYYTVPANTRTIIKKLIFTNFSAGAETVTIHLVPSGGSASDTNKIIEEHPIAKDETFECFEAEGCVLEAGDFLQALCSANAAVNIQGSGIEIV